MSRRGLGRRARRVRAVVRAVEGGSEINRPQEGAALVELARRLYARVVRRGDPHGSREEIRRAFEDALAELADEMGFTGPRLRLEVAVHEGEATCGPRIGSADELRAWTRFLRLQEIGEGWRLEQRGERLVAWASGEVWMRLPLALRDAERNADTLPAQETWPAGC